jgi:phage terminase large subunit GpA-like protein
MCAAESSPGRPVLDPNWSPVTAHEAPPTGGILGIYNRSDRQRWYWKCPDCRGWFEAAPGTKLFNLPAEADLLNEVRTANLVSLARHHAKVVCPHCGSRIEFKWRYDLNKMGMWLLDGQRITADDEIIGEGLQSTIAGFWLGGVAAAYQSWESLLNKHLQGLRDYALTGSETALQVAVNTDQGMPYTPRHLVEGRNTKTTPQERAEVGVQRFICPPETRCVVASVDVQGGVNSRFVIQVHAVGPFREQWVINRTEIRKSKRKGTGDDFAPLDPSRYAEDWDLLTEQLLRSTYRTAIDGLEIRVKMVVVDSGGEDGATDKAYAWFRRIRQAGLSARVRLYKGASPKDAPVIKETLVGNRHGKEKGDIKLLLCNPNLLSDAVDAGMKRETAGPGYIHFPAVQHPKLNPNGWVNQAFFDELGAEVRDKDGRWRQIRVRNETFDLCRMIHVGILALGLDKIRSWDAASVPSWLKPLEENSETITAEGRRALQANAPVEMNDETPLAPRKSLRPAREARPRRTAVSSYLR